MCRVLAYIQSIKLSGLIKTKFFVHNLGYKIGYDIGTIVAQNLS